MVDQDMFITCVSCGNRVIGGAKFCSHCGASLPPTQEKVEVPGILEIYRESKVTGFMYKVKVEVDGNFICKLGQSETWSLSLSSGIHQVKVSGGGLKRSKQVFISSGRRIRLVTQFSDLGILGGGLRLDQQ